MGHTKANRVRVLTEQLYQAQRDRAEALQQRDKALAELALLKESQRHERRSLEIISRAYDKQAMEEARMVARELYTCATTINGDARAMELAGQYPWLLEPLGT